MLRKSGRVLAAFLAVACSSTATLARSPTYYCPWADTVVRLGFVSPGMVELEYAIYPGRRVLQARSAPHPLLALRKVMWFQEADGGFVHDFYFDEDVPELRSKRRSSTNGQVIEQRGYCFAADGEDERR